jgi:hypothetical protein
MPSPFRSATSYSLLGCSSDHDFQSRVPTVTAHVDRKLVFKQRNTPKMLLRVSQTFVPTDATVCTAVASQMKSKHAHREVTGIYDDHDNKVPVKLSLCLTKHHNMKTHWGWRYSDTH